MKTKISLRAFADLEAIYDYTRDQWGGIQAEIYRENIDDVFKLISQQPEMGRLVSTDLKLRQFPLGKHIILYRVTADAIYIMRIKSGSDIRPQG